MWPQIESALCFYHISLPSLLSPSLRLSLPLHQYLSPHINLAAAPAKTPATSILQKKLNLSKLSLTMSCSVSKAPRCHQIKIFLTFFGLRVGAAGKSTCTSCPGGHVSPSGKAYTNIWPMKGADVLRQTENYAQSLQHHHLLKTSPCTAPFWEASHCVSKPRRCLWALHK